jgi:hypothetical protein
MAIQQKIRQGSTAFRFTRKKSLFTITVWLQLPMLTKIILRQIPPFRNHIKMNKPLFACILTILISLSTPLLSQDTEGGKLDPSQQVTIMRYAGVDAKPLVPVAFYNKKMINISFVAEYVSAQRKQPLQTYSFNPKSVGYCGDQEATLDSLFAKAAAVPAVLYFEEADMWFGNNTADKQTIAAKFIALAKKYPGALLVACNTETAWYALAKKGMGIVAIE